MERLTTKNKQFNDYSVAENLRHLDVRDYLYSINQKMGKYEDLEEQIGCPLEVRCKITNGLSIYDKEGNRWIISQIEETYIDVYNSKDSYYTMIFPYSDYKVTWWLKVDRSD